ncbi:hypothetical protein TeGR_g13050, partial [Tetraparma gracilis]
TTVQVKKTAQLDAAGQDARALGQLLVHDMEPVRTKKKLLESKLHVFLFRTTVLRELTDARPWFEALLHQWVLGSPALQELETAHPYFRPFMNVIAKHIISIADFGLKMRLYSGAGLSVFDLVSDVYMIVVFLGSEETRGVAHVNIVCVVLSLLLQLWLAWFVNRKRGWRRIAREALYVVLFIKPGIDAARVAGGGENDDGLAALGPLAELAVSKMIEMVFESIPAAIIQTRAFIISEERSTLALVSIIISCCTTGFAAATMWYDFDTSPAKRKENPRLAGATPDTSRGPFFFLLVVSSALQVVAKSFSSALLFIASPKTFLAYMVGDHAMYQLYLVVRCDHMCFSAGLNTPLSVVLRFVEKLAVDFTSCWLLRSPIQMHGSYFLINQLTTFASVFVSVHLYVSWGYNHLPARMLWTSAISVFAAWVLTYLGVVSMVKPEWRHTFYRAETIGQYAHILFHDNGDDDEQKMKLFELHRCKWRSFEDEIKETAELDAAGQDARALGQLLVHEMEPVRTKKRPEELEARLHVFFYRTTVLRELADVHRWFPKMLFQVLRNLPHRPRMTTAKLVNFTERDALITGRALKMLMLSNATPDAAVDEMRLYSGAGLSVFDLVSDVYMIVVFLGSEETRGVAHVNIACVALSLFWQLALVLFVNKKRPWRRIAKELLYVVSFVKPGIDAARVAGGGENDDGLAAVDPLAELAFSKMFEMVFESIPAAIIQTRAFIISKERSTLALVSIFISCCTTGFAAATMWYDFDTSPAKRKGNPRLAGATPDTSRGPFFFLLVVSGALQVVAKSFSSALLFIASPKTFLAYMVGDHAIYQLYLVVRGDHMFFPAGFNTPLSLAARLGEKLTVDFTSCWLLRSPLEMHSSYFLFNQLTTFASVFASVHLYVSWGGDHLPARMLWISSISVFAAWVLTYLGVVSMVKPEWRHSFYRTETTCQYAHILFHDNGDDDEQKMKLFELHRSKWRSFEDEVRDYTHANWALWKAEKPAWFNEEIVARVPDEFIPVAEVAALNAAAGGKRRRSSVGLADSVRRGSLSE